MTDLHISPAAPQRIHQELLKLAAEVSGDASVRLVHACAVCGGSDHGRPLVRTASGSLGVSVARARSGGIGVVAVCQGAQVGIDVEATGAAAFPGFDDVALHPREHCHDDAERTRLWVRKEALLKSHGTGLATDPRGVLLSTNGQVLVGPPGMIVDLDLGADWTCAVAVAAPTESSKISIIRH